jgi:cobalt-zinc-cadmium efflux system membrane fusion protein
MSMHINFPRIKLNGTHFMTSFQLRSAGALLFAVLLVAGCGKDEPAKADSDKEKASSVTPSRTEKEPANGAPAAKGETHTEEKGLMLTGEEIQTAGIKIAPLQEQEINEQIVVTATIQANQDKLARVAPRVAGKVTKVMANLGDKVQQGQPLALIDSIEAGEAQSAYAQALSEHALAKASVDRAEKLYADQIIPQKDYLRTRADFEKSKAVLRAAGDKRQALGIAGRTGSTSAGASVFAVAAPFSGTIIEKKAVLGELGQSDKPLFSVADLSTVWIEANLYEKDLGKIKVGAPALVTTAAYPGETFKGKVTYISSVMDKESRTARARVEVPNPDGRLKLEMFATAAIATAATAKALLLPEAAVVLVQGQATAFVQEAGGFEARAVDLGDKLRGQVILKAGIKPGEKVVTAGAYALKAKMLKSQISAE